MKLYDISQEVFGCSVYEGDPRPERQVLSSIEAGDKYRLTAFSMCAHNGTHVDAPSHFLANGTSVEKIALSKFVGEAYVAAWQGNLEADGAEKILADAKRANVSAAKRILLKGDVTVTLGAAEVFANAEIDLLGVESQSVGPLESPMAVHLALLEREVVLLEGIRLGAVDEGVYFLNSAPLSLSGSDGAPCRAILMEVP